MSVLALLTAAALAAVHPDTPSLGVAPLSTQDRPAQEQAVQDQPVQLEDLQVSGRRLQDMISDFVNEVAEPVRYRGLARWESPICVGVSNMRTDAAEYIADRVSTVAADLGLQPGAPGCAPNLLIVAAADGGALAEALVKTSPRAFRMGGGGMDRGAAALRDFVNTPRPVRWWQMSAPVDKQTGEIVTRLPSSCDFGCNSPSSSAPQIRMTSASRLNSQIVDRIIRTVVIVDLAEVEGLNVNQLADYVAMVSLAQINPDADTTSYSSILNVFGAQPEALQLTDWDTAYLAGLYSAERTRLDRRANRREITASIGRSHRALAVARDDSEQAQD
jgi:hypothetical protein